ncbi:phage head spike fiber domain-containing protein [Serratia liquefaciens]|uniref:phage head spike fiber domain-containing protein n=1 Tax=Serratia liquefaciens TaxID=614 RepID=UPI0038003899
MTAIVNSNGTFKADISTLPSAHAPLPAGAALFADFSGSRFVMKYATGQVVRSASLKDVLSFTRTSTATRVGRSGLIEYLAVDEPAIEYHPITNKCLGIRTESVSNNRLAYSQAFTQAASWTATGVVLTGNDSAAPDGNATATKLIEASDSTPAARTLEAITTLSATINQPYTFSIWAKANTGKVLQIAAQGAVAITQFVNFDLGNGKIGKSSPQVLQATMEQFAKGWYRCAITITPNAAVSPRFTLALTNNDSSAPALPQYIPASPGSVWVWGAQAERRDGASSYIPTSGAEAQRAADICTTPTTTDFVVASGGTVLMTCVQPHSIQSISGAYNALACAAVLDNSAAGAHLRLAYRQITNNNGQAQWATSDAGGVSQSLEIYSLSPVRDSEQSAIFSFDTPNLNLKLFDGFNWYSRSVTSLPPALNRLAIGRSYIGPENWFNGHIKKVVYWPNALSTEEMERAISYL